MPQYLWVKGRIRIDDCRLPIADCGTQSGELPIADCDMVAVGVVCYADVARWRGISVGDAGADGA